VLSLLIRNSLGGIQDVGGGRNLFSSSTKSPSGMSGVPGRSSSDLFYCKLTDILATTSPVDDMLKKLDSSSRVEMILYYVKAVKTPALRSSGMENN
jgi:hypothetical protein